MPTCERPALLSPHAFGRNDGPTASAGVHSRWIHAFGRNDGPTASAGVHSRWIRAFGRNEGPTASAGVHSILYQVRHFPMNACGRRPGPRFAQMRIHLLCMNACAVSARYLFYIFWKPPTTQSIYRPFQTWYLF